MIDEERPPLRIVLRNFLNHIENLESQIFSDKSYDIEFQALKLFSESVKGLKEYSCLEGEKEINRKKNRYKDILPFDASRVVLQEHNGIPGSDYINANYIKGASGSPAYIASQGPLPSTVNDFWRMVVQCEVHVIVMACNQEEAGKAKCEKYWVDEGEERQFGRISVRLLKSSTVCPDFSVRTMRLKYSNSISMAAEERTVCQVHYVAWPDHGVPSVVHPLLDMVRLVRDTQASETLPVLVHCSAGCGRTGTICAIDYVFGLLRTGKLTSDFSLSSLIRDMRRQRIAMVQTKEQYVLVHQAVRELFREQLSVIDSHPYENVDSDGSLLTKSDQDNIYDTIECAEDAVIFSEKGDFKMEKDSQIQSYAGKKNVTIYSSKQEKEVENLTEQLRSVQAGDRQKVLPNVSKQPYANLQQPFNKSYPKPVLSRRKDDNITTKPIPAKGILRVPLLPGGVPKGQSYPSSSSAGPVKRSKSLKIVPANREKTSATKLTVAPVEKTLQIRSSQYHQVVMPSQSSQPVLSSANKSSQNKRRSSLELITGNPTSEVSSLINLNETYPTKDDRPPINKKYEAINIHGKKTLMRSYTTLDMRHKLALTSVERKLYSAQPLNLRSGAPPWNSPHGKVINFCDHAYCEQSCSLNYRGETSKSTSTHLNTSLPLAAVLQPPAKSYMVRERGNNIYSSSQHSAHFSGIPPTDYGMLSNQPIPRQYHQVLDKPQRHREPLRIRNRSLTQKIFPELPQFYVDSSKIGSQSRDLKVGECTSEIRQEIQDKYSKSVASDVPTQRPYFENRSLIQPPHLFASQIAGIHHPPLPPRNYPPPLPYVCRDLQVNSSSFATAPGVDLDQVAASIPSKDESKSNLMKVALEAFQSKKGKQQKPPESASGATAGPGGSHQNYSSSNKIQQQYL